MGKRLTPALIAKVQQDRRNGVPTREIAARYGISKGSVSRALSEPSTSSPECPRPAPTLPQDAPAPPAQGDDSPETQDDAVERLRAMVQRDLNRLEGAEGEALHIGERSVHLKRLADAMGSLARHATPVAGPLTTEQIMASPNWQSLVAAIHQALDWYPVASAAVRMALESATTGETGQQRDLRLRQLHAQYIAELSRNTVQYVESERLRLEDCRRRARDEAPIHVAEVARLRALCEPGARR